MASLLALDDGINAVVRKGDRTALRSEWSKATVEPLAHASADEKLQAMLIRLDPEGKTGTTSYAPGRRLLAYCTAGSAIATPVPVARRPQ